MVIVESQNICYSTCGNIKAQRGRQSEDRKKSGGSHETHGSTQQFSYSTEIQRRIVIIIIVCIYVNLYIEVNYVYILVIIKIISNFINYTFIYCSHLILEWL
jgi:hypothetical protein